MKKTTYVYEPAESILTDWRGNEIRPEALDLLQVGNIVRSIIKDDMIDCAEGIYVKIIKIGPKGVIKGEVLDTCRHIPPEPKDQELVADGESVRFHRRSIIEIPHDWEGNEKPVPIKDMKTGRSQALFARGAASRLQMYFRNFKAGNGRTLKNFIFLLLITAGEDAGLRRSRVAKARRPPA